MHTPSTPKSAGAERHVGRRRRVSYVLPVYNEAAVLEEFHAELLRTTEHRPDLDFEFVYVDDGSRDTSLEQLLALRRRDHRVTVLSLAANRGHQIAVVAGLEHAVHADAVIVLDTDLQDPPVVSL
ncbi:glycosyltransferase, partial [Nocardioides massiliensis]